MGVLLAVYAAIAIVLGAVPPGRFFGAIREPLLLGFSTDSSAATMPITIKATEEKLHVRPSLAQFIVPLGATVNMGGTALYQGLAAVFMAQMFDIDLPLSALIALVATALGASIGTPAVPGVGIIVLASVLSSAGIPLSGLALIIGVDRILERFRTSLNVTGDMVACAVMDRFMPARISKTEEVNQALEAAYEQQAKEQDVVVAE
jgi:Na+/H+-dicarboxylate symporter